MPAVVPFLFWSKLLWRAPPYKYQSPATIVQRRGWPSITFRLTWIQPWAFLAACSLLTLGLRCLRFPAPFGGAFFGFADEASSSFSFSFLRLCRFPWTCQLHDEGFSETSTSQRQQWGYFRSFLKYL